jgi:hypothetical protein
LRLTAENLEKHCSDTETAERLGQFLQPLLSPTEEEAESRRVAPMEADPAESVLGETAREGWELVRHDQSLALITVPVPQEEATGLIGNCYSGSAGEETYDIGRDSRLTNGVCDVVSDVDGDGSEDYSSDGGSDSDSSDCSSDGGPRVRFNDLKDFDEDDEDSDAFSEMDSAPSSKGPNICLRRSERQEAAAGRHAAPPVTDVQFPSPLQAGHQDKNVTVTGSVSTVDLDTTGQNATASSSVGTVGAAGGIGGGLGAVGLAGQGQKNMRGQRKPAPQRPRKKLTAEERAAGRRNALQQPYRWDGI